MRTPLSLLGAALIIGTAACQPPTGPSASRDPARLGETTVAADLLEKDASIGTLPRSSSQPMLADLSVVSTAERVIQVGLGYVGNTRLPERCNCKEFARLVVRQATGVTIPSTAANKYSWLSSSSVIKVRSSDGSANGLTARGDIIQLLGTNGIEHTLIVYNVTATGMQYIEANYSSCRITSVRTQTFDAFLKSVKGYTVYRIP